MTALFKKLRDNYVINQVKRAKFPVFEANKVERFKVIFSGRVQRVGFRLEVCEIAKRLELTGFIKNLDNGDVMAEFQGSENKIMYLISFMESLKRIRINNKVVEKIEVERKDMGFMRR